MKTKEETASEGLHISTYLRRLKYQARPAQRHVCHDYTCYTERFLRETSVLKEGKHETAEIAKKVAVVVIPKYRPIVTNAHRLGGHRKAKAGVRT